MNRAPTHDLAAERAVLGAALLAPAVVLGDLADQLAADDFHRPAHTALWRTLAELHAAGVPADPVTVAARLAETGALGRIGGAGYLHTLIADVPSAANAGHYAGIIAGHARRRAVVDLGQRLTEAAASGSDTADLLSKGRALLADAPHPVAATDSAHRTTHHHRSRSTCWPPLGRRHGRRCRRIHAGTGRPRRLHRPRLDLPLRSTNRGRGGIGYTRPLGDAGSGRLSAYTGDSRKSLACVARRGEAAGGNGQGLSSLMQPESG